jgi:3-oxoacyl-[acyl-carrier-protein] synthase II
MAVAGSADEMIDEYIITGFSLLRALSDDNENFSTTSRPFDIRRRGFVLGEGGAVLILETLEHAQKRNARVICEFAGYGTSSDGHKITACHKEGLHLKRAMERALQSAGIIADDIDYVNAHGTSTRLNDQAEARALLSLFGAKAGEIAVNSSKSMLGHTVAAAGAIEAAITCMSIKTGMFHPTRNYEKSDPGLDLDFCPLKSGKKDIRAALSNSSGFSGGNSSLCFKKI